MRKRPVHLYCILSAISIVSFIALIVLVICLYNYKSDAILLGLFSAWISIVSGLLFSAIISLIVQAINDNANKNEILERKEAIRNREMNILSREMSLFFSIYHYNEKELLKKYKIQDSLSNKNIDSNIVHSNMQILNRYFKRANQQNKTLIENYLLLSKSMQEQYNKVVNLLCKKRIEFENINIDLNYEIFSKDEIDILRIIPLYIKSYNDNVFLSIDNFTRIVDIFKLEINFDDFMWLSLISILFANDN